MTEVSAFGWLAARIKTPRDECMEVIRRHCAERKVSVAEVMGPSRKRHFHLARRAICLELRAMGRSYPQIGRLFKRDHTTIMNCIGAIKKAKKRKYQ